MVAFDCDFAQSKLEFPVEFPTGATSPEKRIEHSLTCMGKEICGINELSSAGGLLRLSRREIAIRFLSLGQ
jgi:hypothetical protein